MFLFERRVTIMLIVLLVSVLRLYAQKPVLDTSVFGKWLEVGDPVISNDGKYVSYTTSYSPFYSTIKDERRYIQEIAGDWGIDFPVIGYNGLSFTDDSQKAVFMKGKDSLCLLKLGSSFVEYIPHVRSFDLFKREHDEWLSYQLDKPDKELVLRNLKTGKEKTFTGVIASLMSKEGNTLVFKTESGERSSKIELLHWINLSDGSDNLIWKGSVATDNIVLDVNGTQLAFRAQDTVNTHPVQTFWYYKQGTTKAVVLANDHSVNLKPGLHLEGITNFSKDGSRVFLKVKENDHYHCISRPNAVNVDIWSYSDVKLQSEQLKELAPDQWGNGQQHTYTAVMNIGDRHIFLLQGGDDFISFCGDKSDDIAFVYGSSGGGSGGESNWDRASQPVEYVVNTVTGERKQLNRNDAGFGISLSPSGKYVILKDDEGKNLYCYNITTGLSKRITQYLPSVVSDENDYPSPATVNLYAWMDDEKSVIIGDRYDLWKVDIHGVEPSVCLTNGYGRKHHIVFRLAEGSFIYRSRAVRGDRQLLLSAFNEDNKNNGFYLIEKGKQRDPKLLTMGPYVYSMPAYLDIPERPPLKAKDANVWMITRQSASQSPNYFWTKDFKTFHPISQVYPEKKYNWLTSELITFNSLDGRTAQGVLYKPQDFDSIRKYPVIFEYYERVSQALNKYQEPHAAEDRINIPWFVSHGYLVFEPDIHFTKGEPGLSAFNSIVGAAEDLRKLPFVDATHIGIQGHSWGGYETNYIITHTGLFAAAMAASGLSDFVSDYNAIALESGMSLQPFFEYSQCRIGATLWQRPDLYIKNSPIFNADKVTTPLLMMNNKNDGIVPFAQGVELFMALRRLGKKAWMLQYDGEAHSISPFHTRVALDYTARMDEFFDHYLKGFPTPEWMVKGIPAGMKGIDNGLEPEPTGVEPESGLLIKQEENN